MNKKGTKALASATLMSLVLTTALATGNVKAAAGQVTRVGGTDRYETAAKVATANFADGSENVILVNGLSYADSVSASALAKTLNAPILLTTADTLNADAKDALNTLKPKNVYIVGGEAAVSKSVADSLSDYSVTRLSGANRYATNLAVANELVKNHGVSKDNLLVVTGQAYSDALSAAPVAAAKGEILLLSTNDKTAMGDTYDFAKDSNVTVIGTTNSVDAATYSSLNADKRVDGGANRFATNLNILDTFKDDLKADKLYVATAKPNADGANDTQFADALVASAIAGKYSAPLVLTNSDADTATNNAISYIGKTATKTTDLQVVGGTGVVSDKLVGKINDAVNPPVTELAISSVDYVNSNKIVINFNKAVDNTGAIEDDGNRVVVYPAGQSLSEFDDTNADNIRSTSISFSNDKKTATITLDNTAGKKIASGKNYKVDLIDTASNDLNLANSIVSYTGVLSQGIDVPTATVNNDQNNFVITYAQKMNDAALDSSNYTVYDSDNNPVSNPLITTGGTNDTGGTWDDATTKKVVKLPIASGALKAGETYKVIVNDANVKASDGTQLSASQKVFKVVTPGLSDAKPVLKVAQVTGSNIMQLTFSKDLKAGLDIDPDSITVKKAGGTKLALAGAPSVSGKVLTINTSTADSFEDGKSYTVSLDVNTVKNGTFTNAGNDAISNYTVSTPDNVAAKAMTGKFVQNADDSTKYDAVFTFDQQVQPILTPSTGDLYIVDLEAGKEYDIQSTAKAELYTGDSTGKSLVVKDINASFKDGASKALTTDSGKSYKLVATAGVIKTNSLSGSPKPTTSDLKATINGVNTGAPDIDTVTLKSSKEIDVNLKNTTDSSALTSSDVTVRGFIKAADGTVGPLQDLKGSQINVNASGDTITITPKNDTVIFATGTVSSNNTDKVVSIGADTLKNSNNQTNGAIDKTFGDIEDVTDDAAPVLIGAKVDSTGLILTYTENVNFLGGSTAQQASQFDVNGAEENVTATDLTAPTNNTVTITAYNGTPFVSGNDYSSANVKYAPNSNYKIQDSNSNDASAITLTGIVNGL